MPPDSRADGPCGPKARRTRGPASPGQRTAQPFGGTLNASPPALCAGGHRPPADVPQASRRPPPRAGWLRGLNIQQLLTFDGIDNDFRIVHVRGGDYFTSKSHKPYVKNRDWYLKAIAAVPDMRKHQDKIILCTDDGKYAKKILPEFPILDVPPLTAFRLMMGCRSLVISASSFSWWAGYLNPSAQIAAPSRWCGAGEDSAKYYGHSRLMFIPD